MNLFDTVKKWLLEHLLPAPPDLYYIGGSDVLPPPLDKAREEAAIKASEAGDESAKQLLIEHNRRLVVYMSRRF